MSRQPIRTLKVIPEPPSGTATVFTRGESKNTDPFLGVPSGTPVSEYLVCGACQTVLATIPPDGGIVNVVLHCFVCGAFNAT